MSEFKREHRYWVFKRKHLSTLEDAAMNCEFERLKDLDPAISPTCSVIEADWPEHDIVWEMIQARVEGRPNIITTQAATIEALREALDLIINRDSQMFTLGDACSVVMKAIAENMREESKARG